MYKVCPECINNKPYSDYSKNKNNKDGLAYHCKICAAMKNKKWRKSRPDIVRRNMLDSRNRYTKEWCQYFEQKYGKDITCQICDVPLNYGIGKLHFDHRYEGSETITTSPAKWAYARPCSKENQLIWDQCDFGILCNKCNRKLPTLNRLEWLKRINQYVIR